MKANIVDGANRWEQFLISRFPSVVVELSYTTTAFVLANLDPVICSLGFIKIACNGMFNQIGAVLTFLPWMMIKELLWFSACLSSSYIHRLYVGPLSLILQIDVR